MTESFTIHLNQGLWNFVVAYGERRRLVYFVDGVAVQLSNDYHWGEDDAPCINLGNLSRFSVRIRVPSDWGVESLSERWRAGDQPSFRTAHTGYEPVEGRRNSTSFRLLARFQRGLARRNGLVFWHVREFSADTLIRIFVF